MRREQLLAAAREVFRERGYARTTVADIAKAAGLAVGSVYVYFRAKPDIFYALRERLRAMYYEAQVQADNPSLPIQDRIRRMTEAMFDCAMQNTDLIRLMNYGRESMPVDLQREAMTNPNTTYRAAVFQRAMDAGEIAPGNAWAAARLVSALVRNAIQDLSLIEDEEVRKAYRRATGQFLVNALVCGSPVGSPQDPQARYVEARPRD